MLGSSPPGGGLDQLDQVIVAVGDGFALHLQPGAFGEPDIVETVDDDVRDVGVVDVLLDAAQGEQFVDDRAGEFVAFGVGDRILAGVHGLGVEVLDLLGDELVGEHSPVLALDGHAT